MQDDFSLVIALEDILRNLTQSTGRALPRILTAVAVIVIGFIVAKIAERVLRGVLRRIRMDLFLEKIGAVDLLRRLGIVGPPSELVSRLVYILLLILFLQSATDAVGLTTISQAISALFAYLPNLFAALLIFLLGNLIADFASKTVTRSAAESGIDYAPTLGRVVSALIFFVIAIMAVTQLQIETEIIHSVSLVILGGISLGFAITFGLGTRDITRNIIAGFYARKLFVSGEEVEIQGYRGTLIAITPIQTLVQGEERVIAYPNKVFLDDVVKQ